MKKEDNASKKCAKKKKSLPAKNSELEKVAGGVPEDAGSRELPSREDNNLSTGHTLFIGSSCC